MAEVSIDLDMVRVSNEDFLKKAGDCAPQLKETLVHPVEIVDIRETDGVYPEVLHRDSVDNMKNYHMKNLDMMNMNFIENSQLLRLRKFIREKVSMSVQMSISIVV